MTREEAEAVVQRALAGEALPLPSLSIDSDDDLVVRAQDARTNDQWSLAYQALAELYRRHPAATTAQDLGQTCCELGRWDEAIQWFRTCLMLDPTNAHANEHLIFLIDAQPHTTEAEAQRERRDHFLRFGAAAYAQRQPHVTVKDPEKRLRVGYVSKDWNFHSAGVAFSSVVSQHTSAIEPVLYSTLHPKAYDFTTKHFWKAKLGAAFVDVHQMTQEWLAKVIREDQIDILVDLSGYTDGNRLQTFAYKPAPIQIQAWGYVLGTNSPAIDVIFADATVSTSEIRASRCERIYELPSLLGFMPRNDLPEDISPLPCVAYQRPVVFGVMQRAIKGNPETWATWRAILERVPESRLLFKGPDYTLGMRERIVEAFGPLRNRLDFLYNTGNREHQLCYQDVDLALDPWPQTGGVSTLEALWMGVPTVTLLGDRMIQRASASILTNVGYGEDCVALSKEEYIDRAVALVTTERDKLTKMRAGARERLKASPIMLGYVEAVEAAYRELWREWCAKEQ